jgi:hypothetical protein
MNYLILHRTPLGLAALLSAATVTLRRQCRSRRCGQSPSREGPQRRGIGAAPLTGECGFLSAWSPEGTAIAVLPLVNSSD